MLRRDPPAPKTPVAKDDPVKVQLKRAIRRGPRRRARLIIALVLLALVAGMLAFLFWPRTPVPPLLVVAFDEVAIGQPQVTLRAATEPADGGDVRWGGRELFFEEVRGLPPGASGTTKKVTSDANGLGQIAWQFSGASPSNEMEVRYLDERQRPPWSDRDHSRVFFWPADARILAVDVALLLKPGKDGDREAAVKALAAAAEKGWRIAYLAVDADRPLAYRKLRATLRQAGGAEPGHAVEGPVLARRSFYNGASPGLARMEILADLKRSARGPVLCVIEEQGLKLWTVGPGNTLAGGLPVADWNALAAALPQ
jgi:hypothetical protein